MTSPNAEMFAPEPSPELNAYCLDLYGRWEDGRLPFEEAVAALNTLREETLAGQRLADQGRVENMLGIFHHYRGNLNTSIMHYERARKLYERVGNRRRMAIIDLNQGENYRNKGEFVRARKLYQSAYQLAREAGDIETQGFAIANEGLVLTTLGDYPNARKALLEGYEFTKRYADPNETAAMRCEIHHALATICLGEGHLEAAWIEACKALENAHITRQPLQIGLANRALGEVVTELGQALHPNFSSNPDDYFRAAVAAFEEIQAESEMARTLLAHAKSLAKRRKTRSAAKLLQQAMIIFQRQGMTHEAARAAEAQLAVT